MASNKDSKTSKTAHVMNLLSKNRGSDSAADLAEAPQAAAPAPGPTSPIISSINADAAVSTQIRDALSASLEQPESPVPEQPLSPPAEAARHTEPPAAEAAPAAPAPQASAIPPAPAQPHTAPMPGGPSTSERPAYVNVMQVLVEEKAEKYMKLSGMCLCDMCKVDVKAYALTHLPPKYVVMSKGEMIPKLTLYEAQHSSDITAQLMKACQVVSEAPHHSR